MSNPQGPNPWSPTSGSNDPKGGRDWIGGDGKLQPEHSDEPELVNEPVQRNNVPIKIMLVALVALVVTIGLVGFFVTRTTDVVTPVQTPAAPDPTGPPDLPLQANQYAREPGNASAPPEFGVDQNISTSYATYKVDGENALIAIGARPVADAKMQLDEMKVLAQRQVGDGWCGREPSSGLDVCILKRNRTAVLVMGLRDQTVDELMTANIAILAGTK